MSWYFEIENMKLLVCNTKFHYVECEIRFLNAKYLKSRNFIFKTHNFIVTNTV